MLMHIQANVYMYTLLKKDGVETGIRLNNVEH